MTTIKVNPHSDMRVVWRREFENSQLRKSKWIATDIILRIKTFNF